MLWLFLGPTRVYLLDFFCTGIQFYLLLSFYLLSLRWCIDKLGSFVQTKYLCVLIHIWIKGEVGAPWNRFKSSSKKNTDHSKAVFPFMDHLCNVCLVFVMLWRLFIATFWTPVGIQKNRLDETVLLNTKKHMFKLMEEIMFTIFGSKIPLRWTYEIELPIYLQLQQRNREAKGQESIHSSTTPDTGHHIGKW